jgi:hypothetical protein
MATVVNEQKLEDIEDKKIGEKACPKLPILGQKK